MTAKLTHQQFVDRAIAIHGDKYEYIGEYLGTEVPIKIKCLQHGIFNPTPHNHITNSSGCPFCANNIRSISYKKDHNLFVKQCNIVHNNKYKYVGEYIGNKYNIDIECPVHSIFSQKAIHHLNGSGCPTCNIGANVSRAENAWLGSLGIPLELRQASLKIDGKLIKPDAFDPATKTIYEFYGDYWHGNPMRFEPEAVNLANKKTFGKLYQDTIDREQLIKKAGYNLIFIWEYDWKNE
jgi:hypothetical protein